MSDPFNLPPYADKCKLLDLSTLERRRFNGSVMFVFDLISGQCKSSKLASLVKFNAPLRQLRSHELLHVGFHRTNYGMFEPISAACRAFNQVSECYVAGISRDSFRIRVNARR